MARLRLAAVVTLFPVLAFATPRAGRGAQDPGLPVYHDRAESLGVAVANRFGSPDKKLITETTGSGAAWLDYDGDGDVDLYVVDGRSLEEAAADAPGRPNRLYRNDGSGSFTLASEAGVGDTGWGGGAAAADVDNDGDLDLLVTNNGPNVFYRNNGDGTFTDATLAAGLSDPRWSTSAAFGDVDGDGFVDVYVCNYIAFREELLERLDARFCMWRGVPVMCGPNGLPGEADALLRNRGDGTFEDVTRAAGVYDAEGKGLGVSFVDFDGDLDQDIYVGNDSTPDFLYQNDGTGRFTDVALLAGVAVSMYGKAQAGMGVDAGDFDGDGRPDLVVTNFQGDYNALRRNEGMGLFTDVSDESGLTAPSFERLGWGVKFVDVDHDSDLDLFVANGHVYPEVDGASIDENYGQPNQLFENVGNQSGRRFVDASSRAGPGLDERRSSRGVAFGDIDSDMDLDVFISNIDDVPTLLVDESAHANGRVRLTLVGRTVGRDGLGARVEARLGATTVWRDAGAIWSYLSTSDRRVLVGLGEAKAAENVRVVWSNGTVDDLGPLEAGDDVVVIEGIGRAR